MYDGQGFIITGWAASAHELALLNILMDYEVNGKSLILDYKTCRIGISYYGHEDQKKAVAQVLYIYHLANLLN